MGHKGFSFVAHAFCVDKGDENVMITDLLETTEAQSGFYPTPPTLAEIILADIKWAEIETVLEPSAGKGDLVIPATKLHRHTSRSSLNVDCIEIDPALRGILKYKLQGQMLSELEEKIRMLEKKKRYDYDLQKTVGWSQDDYNDYDKLKEHREVLSSMEVRIVHNDFLTFCSRKHYDLIIMNPPFAEGEKHLLKAIELQSRGGGIIRCVLNAETLKNPFSVYRLLLKQKLEEYGAEIEYLDNAFSCSDAERKSNVQVAVVKIRIIKEPPQQSDIFDRLTKAAEVTPPQVDDIEDMVVADFVQQIVSRFNVEVDAGIELIDIYEALQPFILESVEEKSYRNSPNLWLIAGDPDSSRHTTYVDRNKYVKLVRQKYWEALFRNQDYVGKLTNDLQRKYLDMLTEMANYDFTAFNIKAILVEMNSEMASGVEKAIFSLFDQLSEQYSYYPEMSKNIHYFNGWKTNKVHKVNSKVIIPAYGIFSSYSSRSAFDFYRARDIISEIEKVFNYLDGHMTASVSLSAVLQNACESGETKNIRCKFFDINLYKKGTMHIKFRCQDLVDRLNIYVCRNKNWLPPCYGEKAYSDMEREERAVVDSFHGDGSEGAGAEEYSKVMARKDYFLAEPKHGNSNLLQLTA